MKQKTFFIILKAIKFTKSCADIYANKILLSINTQQEKLDDISLART